MHRDMDFGKCDGENITVPAFILPDGTVKFWKMKIFGGGLKNLQLGETISTGVAHSVSSIIKG